MKTLHMLHIDENEHPMSIQLFGGDAEGLKRAADFIQTNTKADIVDINMGCPVNKVVKNEAGAKWLKGSRQDLPHCQGSNVSA